MICRIENLDNLLVSDVNQLYLLQVSDDAEIKCTDMFTGETVDESTALRAIELAMDELQDYFINERNSLVTK